ncbi:MAG: hypothetical protein HY840_14085 [Bacteroidetes bacterium]|nr:hypothetical protein [Bacteroidota bacterium]
MYLFAAGGGKFKGKDYGTWCAEQEVHKLYSINGEGQQVLNYNHPHLKLVADSGGHIFNKGSDGINPLGHERESDPPDPKKYLEEVFIPWVYKFKDISCTIFELDIYGHLPIDTIDGVFRELSSIKGKFQFVRCFHPLGIDGDYSLRTLKKWVSEGQDYIAISNSSDTCYHDIFKITTPNNVRLHGLALTGTSVLSKYPFFSADSSNALVTPFKSGTVVLDSGKNISIGAALDERSLNYILYRDFESRLVQSIKMFKEAEGFYTRLWESRGIIWK